MSFRVSTHAIDRYIERIDPSASEPAALSIITNRFNLSVRQRERTYAGEAIYLCPEMRLIVAEENGHREVVTVIPLHEPVEGNIPELAEELQAEFLVWQKEKEPLLDPSMPPSDRFSGLMHHIAALERGLARRQRIIATLNGAGKKRAVASPRRAESRVRQLQEQVEGLKKRVEKQVAHGERMTADREVMRETLKALLRPLIAGDLETALRTAEACVPELVVHLRTENRKGGGEE